MKTCSASLPALIGAALLLQAHAARAETQCQIAPMYQDNSADAKWASMLSKLKTAEKMVLSLPVYHASPRPVRLRTLFSNVSMIMRAYPEKSGIGIQLWEGECGVINGVERIGSTDGGFLLQFNHSMNDAILRNVKVPRLTGHVGGFPEYEGWVVITKDGRLPFIPKTLAELLDEEGQRRERTLAEWRTDRSRDKAPDEASIRKTHDLLAKTDPEGAKKYVSQMQSMLADIKHRNEVVYPATRARMEKEVSDYKAYRASFSAEELARPGSWSDSSGADKRELDARIVKMKALPPADQQNYDAWTRESRDLERQARTLDKTNKVQAAELRVRSNELSLRARGLLKAHQERSVDPVLYAMSEYALFHVKPGTTETAMEFKEDPDFPDRKSSRVQLITAKVQESGVPERKQWMQRTKDSIDWASLAALLD